MSKKNMNTFNLTFLGGGEIAPKPKLITAKVQPCHLGNKNCQPEHFQLALLSRVMVEEKAMLLNIYPLFSVDICSSTMLKC